MMSRLLARPPAKALAILLIAMLCLPTAAAAQAPPADGGAKPFKPEELEQIAAPIALYPDPLVAQVLMASTYPLEVVQAARFVKASPNLTGSKLADELKKYDWDDSVKALVPFPQVLSMMNDKLDWMQQLGDAFLAQQKELMDTIQKLRQKAQAQGHLKDSKEQKVIVEPAPAPPAGQPSQQTTVIKIEPADPQVVYVPTYNPTVVYGAWPYPAYPPYYYYPPGYAFAGAAFGFAAGVAVGAAFGGAWGWGGCNWGGGEVDIDVNKNNNFTKNVNKGDVANKRAERQGQSNKFQHNPEHRKGAQYRDTATQQRFDKSGPANAQSREQFRGRAEQGRQDLDRGGQQGARGGGDRGAGAGQGGVGDRGDAGRGQGDRAGAGGGQQGAGGGGDRGAGSGQGRGSAFEGAGGGAAARAESSRGNASRESSSASRDGAGGGSRSSSSSMQSGGGSRTGGSSGGGGGSRGGGGGRSGGGGGGRGGGGRR